MGVWIKSYFLMVITTKYIWNDEIEKKLKFMTIILNIKNRYIYLYWFMLNKLKSVLFTFYIKNKNEL